MGMEEIEFTVRELKRIRNCSMISIAGGEPLMHSQLLEGVRFIRSENLYPFILTNGFLLTDSLAAELRRAGLAGVMTRIDALQQHQAGKTEQQLMTEREQYCAMCCAHDLHLTFTSCIDPSNLAQIPAIIRWAGERASDVQHLLLILKRPIILSENDAALLPPTVTLEELVQCIRRESPGFHFSAFLGSEAESQQAKWLQAHRCLLRGTTLGYLDKKCVEWMQMVYHFRTSRYLSLLDRRKSPISIATLTASAMVNRSVRVIWFRFLRAALTRPLCLLVRVSRQVITVVSPPYLVNGRRDFCDGCPDAILYRGTLVPSCALEEIATWGHPYEAH